MASSQDQLGFRDPRKPRFKVLNQSGRKAHQHPPAQVRVRQGLPRRMRVDAQLRCQAGRLHRGGPLRLR
eukprot:2824732-Alexandrium_andersonii.AAC.1